MARERIAAIVADAVAAHGLCAAAAEHRVGEVSLSEPSVAVAVSAPHRGEAFTGAREIIDRVKAEAPIWKKEVEGEDERWVPGTPPPRLDAAGLPRPNTNRPAGSKRVDCRWPDLALTVELDSYRFHATRHAWEQDRRRDRQARARGDEIRRYTWADVHEDPGPMMRELGALLRG